MAIDSNGLTIKRYDEILADLETALRSYFGNNIDLSENALLGIINIIYANAQAEQWEMAQAVYNAFNIEVATGKQLDDLVALLGLSRLDEEFSSGGVELVGDDGTVVTTLDEFRTSDTDIPIFLESDVTITASNCFQAKPAVTTATDGNSYTVLVNNVPYNVVATGVDTLDTIMQALTDLINADTTASWTASFTLSDPHFTVTANTVTFPMSVIVNEELTISEVSSRGIARTDTIGPIAVNENTVTVVPSVAGLTASGNIDEFSLGRLNETDDELRARHSISTALLGSSSPDSMESRIREVESVTSAELFENITMAVDARGLPPKSFEMVVVGGTDEEVAAAIYAVKPSGIETYGNTTVVIPEVDDAINFSRPNEVEIFVEVTYTLYNEELFPVEGEASIAQAIHEFANTLSVGEDVIAQRMFGEIYKNVEGIQSLDIKLGYTAGTITEDVLPMSDVQVGAIPLDNISVSL
jgi:uncharacterized phage protein gp47/JayE